MLIICYKEKKKGTGVFYSLYNESFIYDYNSLGIKSYLEWGTSISMTFHMDINIIFITELEFFLINKYAYSMRFIYIVFSCFLKYQENILNIYQKIITFVIIKFSIILTNSNSLNSVFFKFKCLKIKNICLWNYYFSF